MTRLRSLYAFTLIELLVVIGIISLLCALLFPIFASARRQARTTMCLSNLRQIGVALQLYQSDWGRMPTESFRDTDRFHAWSGSDPLKPYTKNGGIYHCPEADPNLAGNYIYRAGMSLTQHETGVPYISDNKTIRLSSLSVLAFCWEHAKAVALNKYEGAYVVVRADTSAQRIPVEKTVLWGYHEGRWLQAPRDNFPSVTTHYPVFPDEPWPPEFED